jgi:hypothetical protein
VVEAMAESIIEVRTQFPPAILVGPPTALTFEVTEGQGFSLPKEVILTNNGSFGSLLGATLTASAEFISVTPAQIGNLSSNETGAFDVAVDSTGLLALDSPYSGSITIQDPTATNNPQVLPISINVVAQATIDVASTTLFFTAIKPMTGPFPIIPSQTFVIENTGPSGSVLAWQIQRVGCAPWLASFAPISGTLNSGETETITVVASPPVSTLLGTYSEVLRITAFSTNETVDVTLQLTIT